MQTLTINIQNESLTEKFLWMLEYFKSDGLEISSKEDNEDLKHISKPFKTKIHNKILELKDFQIYKILKNSQVLNQLID